MSELFHLNSEPWLNEEAYHAAPYHQEFKDVRPAGRAVLPPPPDTHLSKLTRERKSVRKYDRRRMPLDLLSSLLAATSGAVEGGEMEGGGGSFLRRSAPSAGGLYPLESYVFLQEIDQLADGLYHYDVLAHALQLIEAGNLFARLEAVFYTYPFIRDANVVLCQAAVFMRAQRKYGPRGYRYILLEAGHAAQNFCLTATSFRLGTLCMGGFIDTRLNTLLRLDQPREGVVYSIAAGYPAE